MLFVSDHSFSSFYPEIRILQQQCHANNAIPPGTRRPEERQIAPAGPAPVSSFSVFPGAPLAGRFFSTQTSARPCYTALSQHCKMQQQKQRIIGSDSRPVSHCNRPA
jgi:hypothetical protein